MKQVNDQKNWQIETGPIDPNQYFGAMVGNGMVGMVSDAKPMHIREVILNGVYDRYLRGKVSNILQTFKHLNLDLVLDGHAQGADNYSKFEQTLDLKKACLISEMETKGKLIVKHELRALRQLPYTGLVVVEVTALDDIKIELHNNMEGPSHLRDFQNYFSEIDRPHALIQLMSSIAKSPSGKLEVAAANAYIFEEKHGEEPRMIHEDWDQNRHLVKIKKNLKKGQTYTFAIVGTTMAGTEIGDIQNQAERVSIYAKLEGLERLIEQHEKAWQELWRSDIEIGGDPIVQRDVRMMLYNLYSSIRAGSRLSLSPVGLSSFGYNGHVFWDTELWMYPPLLFLQPEMAKSILDYRLDRLEAARENAFMHGFKGAKFPWESAGHGGEETPVWALTGPFQIHISACISWAFWKYFQLSRDEEWLRREAWPLMEAVAEFWTNRVERTDPNRYEINNVIGANEFEENIDNNAFTNGIVKTVLRDTHTAAKILGFEPNPDWMDVADKLPILTFEDGTTKENETYTGAEIKQADANLLSFPIRLIRDESRIRKDLDFYEARMSPDGPAMGVATLATIHARLNNPNKAYQLFLQSYQPNQLPPFGVLAEVAGGRGVSPYFMTGAGGTLQTLLMGFAGLDLEKDGIQQTDVCLPDHWTHLNVKGLGLAKKNVSIKPSGTKIS